MSFDLKDSATLERLYGFILSASEDLIALIDRNYHYIIVNDAYLKFHHKTYKEVIGKPVVSIIGEENFHNIKPILDEVLGGKSIKNDYYYTHPNGSLRHEEIDLRPYIEDEDLIGFIITIRDKS